MKPLILTDPILKQASRVEAKAERRKAAEEIAVEDARAELELLVTTHVEQKRGAALIAMLEKSAFWRAPASSNPKLHGAFEGGLAVHTLLVVRHMRVLNIAWDVGLAEESVIVSGIVHDFAKAGLDGKPYYVPLGDGTRWRRNEDLPAVGQNALSILCALRHQFVLTPQEFEAVMAQDGMYSDESRSVMESGRKLNPLSYLLHHADLWCSAVIGV